MINDARKSDEPSVRLGRPRFRFSLKVVFVVMTLACALLGWYVARQHQAAEIVSRNRAVRDVIERNLSSGPDKTSFVFADDLRQRSINFRQSHRPDPKQQIAQISRFSGDGSFYQTATFNELLVVTQLLQDGTPSAVAAQIVKYYERGLAELGLRKTVQTGETERESAIWQANDHGMHIVIDVDVRPKSSTANVRIILLHNERLTLW
jgi:hypothetical protein